MSTPIECSFPGPEAPWPATVEGVISHLTKKHGGNVHEKGIVTITSKSVDDNPRHGLKNVADLTTDSWFSSKKEPAQWICWDFHEMRVRPTEYTIRAYDLKSWLAEGSLDGTTWTEIDHQTNNQDFNESWWKTASFVVAKPTECRFIRLTMTDKNHVHGDMLLLPAVEFFGTLSE
jgi:hypothetical protein